MALLLALLLAGIGIVNLTSADSSGEGGLSPAALRQLFWVGIAFVAMLVVYLGWRFVQLIFWAVT